MQFRLSLALLICVSLASGCFVNTRIKPGATTSNQAALAPVVVKPPTANLMASVGAVYQPASYQEVAVGDTVEFYWNGSHADLYESTYISDAADTCPASAGAGSHVWVAASAQGNTSRQIAPCEAGRTYLYTYKVTSSDSGLVSSAYNMVHVISNTTAAYSVLIQAVIPNSLPGKPTGILVANVGQFAHVTWSSVGVDAGTTTSYSVDSPDSCGDLSLTLPKVQNQMGMADVELRDCMGGHTYTIVYSGYKGSALVATSTLVLRVRANNPSKDPVPYLKLNGQTGSVDVKVGDTLNFTWSADDADLGDSAITVAGLPSSSDCVDDQARGNNSRPWSIRSAEGLLPASTVPACRAGKTYNLVFTATQSQSGKSASVSLTVNFKPAQ